MFRFKNTAIKYSAVYSCPDEIKKFRIRIKIGQIEDVNETPERENIQWIYKEFRWQEKVFSKFEKEIYKDSNSCLTDLEKKYHNLVKLTEDEADYFLYSYVDEDGFTLKEPNLNSRLSKLETSFEAMDLNNDEDIEDGEEYNFRNSVVSAINNPIFKRHLEKMFIMADFGDYIEETWIKYDEPLCILKYDKTNKTLSVYPDFTKSLPYHIRVNDKNYLYFIEDTSPEMPENILEMENELIKKIGNQKNELKFQHILNNLSLPPKNKLYVYIFLEILTGKCFEYQDVYVQYFVDLPEFWICQNKENLKGITQTCHGKGKDGLVHFDHCLELILEYNIQELEKHGVPKCPYIYFEVISKDSWNRYRTEGLAYKDIPVGRPGLYNYEMRCFRLCPQSISGNLRRFFIGDCSNYNDITWIGIPKDHEGKVLNKYGVNTIGTGDLSLRINVLHQSQAFLSEFNKDASKRSRDKLIFEKINSSSLVKSVDQVLKAFRTARKNMLEARKNV